MHTKNLVQHLLHQATLPMRNGLIKWCETMGENCVGWYMHHHWYVSSLVYYVFLREIFAGIGRANEFELLCSEGEEKVQALDLPELQSDQKPFSEIEIVMDLCLRNVSLVGLFEDEAEQVDQRYPFWEGPDYQRLVALVSKDRARMEDLRGVLVAVLVDFFTFIRIDTFAENQYWRLLWANFDDHQKHLFGMASNLKRANQHYQELLRIYERRLGANVGGRMRDYGINPSDPINDTLAARVQGLEEAPWISEKLRLLDSIDYRYTPKRIIDRTKDRIKKKRTSFDEKIDIEPPDRIEELSDSKQVPATGYDVFHEFISGEDNDQELLRRLDQEFGKRRTWPKERKVLALLLENAKTSDSRLTNKFAAQELGFSESSVERYRKFIEEQYKKIREIREDI
jgi:hypothetical protein